MIEAYFDGACEPVNPGGTAAYGAVVLRNGVKIFSESKIFHPEKGREYRTSNNIAEYSGFLAILQFLISQNLQESYILVRGDSNLVIQQMFVTNSNHGKRWRIKGGYYVPVALKCQDLLKRFPHIAGEWIPREKNSLADELSKAELHRAGIIFRIQPER